MKFNFIFLFLFLFCILFSGCTSEKTRTVSSSNIEYFNEIALGSEYGSNIPVVMKYVKKNVTIKVHNFTDSNSEECLHKVIKDFNEISTSTQLKIIDSGEADIDIYFIPEYQFSQIDKNYTPLNYGFFWGDNNTKCELTKRRILIDTQTVSPTFQCHLIREEVTQNLGLMKDSKRWPNSIFYADEGSDMTFYSEIDKDIIWMLYSTDIPPCSTKTDVEKFFKSK